MSIDQAPQTGVPLSQIVTCLDEMLETAIIPDYPNALNGLQLSNRRGVRKIGAAVDFSTQTARAAIEGEVDLLLVHHGIFWAGLQPIAGPTYTRLRELIEADVAVYASHLPLDRHPRLGNNVLLATTLGLKPSAGFARFKDIFIGVRGETDIPTQTLVDRARKFSRANAGDTITTAMFGIDRRTRRWAICTGAGASADTLAEATMEGIDTLIVGEGPHWTAVEAVERGLTIIYVGHYASETLGIYALAAEVSRQFDLDWMKISAPTGL